MPPDNYESRIQYPVMCLDIETAPLPLDEVKDMRPVPAAVFIEAPTDEQIVAERDRAESVIREKLAAKYKKPETIAQHLKKDLAAHMKEYCALENWGSGKWMEKAALDYSRGRVHSIGYLWLEGPGAPRAPEAIRLHIGEPEREMLATLARGLRKCRTLVGHNIVQFDVWMVVQRARVLGLPTRWLYEQYFRTPEWKRQVEVVDIQDAWMLNRWAGLSGNRNDENHLADAGPASRSLSAICRYLGIAGKIQESGEGFHLLRRPEQEDYLRQDVWITWQAAVKLMEWQPTQEELIAHELIEAAAEK